MVWNNFRKTYKSVVCPLLLFLEYLNIFVYTYTRALGGPIGRSLRRNRTLDSRAIITFLLLQAYIQVQARDPPVMAALFLPTEFGAKIHLGISPSLSTALLVLAHLGLHQKLGGAVMTLGRATVLFFRDGLTGWRSFLQTPQL